MTYTEHITREQSRIERERQLNQTLPAVQYNEFKNPLFHLAIDKQPHGNFYGTGGKELIGIVAGLVICGVVLYLSINIA